MCYPPLRSQFISTRAVRPADPARQRVFASVPASGRQVLYNAAIGRGLFSNCGAHVLRRSRAANVALNEFRLSAFWSSGASIESGSRAHRAVVVRAPDTFVKRGIALQRWSTQRLASRFQLRPRTGLACSARGWPDASPARPNLALKRTPSSKARPHPGAGAAPHFAPGCGHALLPGSA
jgi:hypothetical protein